MSWLISAVGFLAGLIQLFAVMDGVAFMLGVGTILSFILALIVTYIPIVGTLVGVYSAVKVWDWSLLSSIALFFWYIPVLIIVGIVSNYRERW